MNAEGLAIVSTGFVTSVGLNSDASCAAIRAKVSNPSETRFIDAGGEWIIAHSVPLLAPLRGTAKVVRMAISAIKNCLANINPLDWVQIPLLLCVAELDRPGRLEGLDSGLLNIIQRELGVKFGSGSRVIAHGRTGVAVALLEARKLIALDSVRYALIVATDSLIVGATLRTYERSDRLLTSQNSNGFIPGEGAGAVLVGPAMQQLDLVIRGLGFAQENATIEGVLPLKGEGLSVAIKNSLAEADCEIHDLSCRITDLSGEQYYFKEAALALSRILRKRKEEFEIWHPAECIGETGALGGLATVIVAHSAHVKGYAPGPGMLCHASNDNGQRVAIVMKPQVN